MNKIIKLQYGHYIPPRFPTLKLEVPDLLSQYKVKPLNLDAFKLDTKLSSLNPQLGWENTKKQTSDLWNLNENNNSVPAIPSDTQNSEKPKDITNIAPNLGTIFSQGLSTAGSTITGNIVKGYGLTEGLKENVAESLGGAAVGYAGNLIGQGINSLGGNSMLSRGIGQGVATGIGTIGGQAVSNLLNGKKAFQGISDSFKAIKTYKNAVKDAKDIAKVGGSVNDLSQLKNLSTAAKWNLAGIGGQIVGSGLQAAFGPSKEYGGKYGNITQGMDTAYDLVQTGVGFIPGFGTAASGMMALNKGLSNIFGSTDGMTKTDAILGSAFMPAPVKWLNMAGASTTGSFNNQSWQNTEKADSFMGNAFGDLGDKFQRAREEAGKTYGTFSQGAYRDAQKNINFANNAWDQILAMADQNEYQNIRSQIMSSINNQRYAQMIQGGWNPIYRGKQGMKIFNNATNHNIGMRLLSAAALIDNKQMILCSAAD